MAVRHTREEVLAFLKGETAQVVARDSRTGAIVVLRQGQADALRVVTREFLRCPVEGCPDPRLEAIGGSTGRRHHFRHQSGGGHSSAPESLFHYQSKLILAQWARESALVQGMAVRINVDNTFVGEEVQKKRKPDVLIELLSTCKRLAFEVEYFNSTDVRSLGERRSDYHDAAIKDIWIFGHTSRHIKSTRADYSRALGGIKISSVLARIGETGDPILVINPIERLVGTLIQDSPPSCGRWWEQKSTFGLNFASLRLPGDSAVLYLDSLDDCQLDENKGIVTPAMEKVRQSRIEIELLAQEAEAAFLEERRKQDQILDEQMQARRETQKKINGYRVLQEEIWKDHDLRKRLMAYYGKIPPVISVQLEHDDGIYAHHEHWHALLFQEFIAGNSVGSVFTVRGVYGYLSSLRIKFGNNPEWRAGAIIGYLRYLQDQGYLQIDARNRYGGRIEKPIRVLSNKIMIEQPKEVALKKSDESNYVMVHKPWQVHMIEILRSEPKTTFSDLKRRLPPTVTDWEFQDAWDFIDETKEWGTEGDQN